MTRCPECGHKVSSYADICPNCGYPLKRKRATESGTIPEERLHQRVGETVHGYTKVQNITTGRYYVFPSENARPGGTCPWCGSQLVKRNSPRGTFLGCSGFPDCTFSSRLAKQATEQEHERSERVAKQERKERAAEEEWRGQAAERERAWKADEERRKAAAREEVLRELERVRREAEQRKNKEIEREEKLADERPAEDRLAEEKRTFEDEKAKEQKLLKLDLLSTLTITVASATNAVLSFLSGGILLLILSALISGAATLSLCGLLELRTLVEKVSSREETDILSQADQIGKLSAGYSVPLAVVAFVTKSPVWACIAVSQLTSGLSCMFNVSNGQSQTPKVILGCVSLVSLVCAFGFLSMN